MDSAGLKTPSSLLNLCLLTLIKNFDNYTWRPGSIILPDELLRLLIELLNKRRKLDDATLAPFLHHNLRALNLTNCQNVHVLQVMQKCPNLRSLSLRGCLTVSDVTLAQIAQHCDSLMSVALTYNRKVTDDGIQLLTSKCTSLQELDLSWCARLTDRSLISIATHCTQLRELSISSCKEITGEGVQAVVSRCQHLRHLELRACTGIQNIPELYSTSLKVLNLGHCTELSPQFFVQTEDSKNHCPNLTELNLAACSRITDKTLDNLLSSCKQITSLDLSLTNLVAPEFLHLSQLTYLNMDGCKKLQQPDTFCNLTKGCPKLKEAHFKGCTSLTDESIHHLTTGITTSALSPNNSLKTSENTMRHYSMYNYRCSLEHLDLSRCTDISDRSVLFIVNRCFALKYLDVSWCPDITDNALDYLSREAKRLSTTFQTLKIFGCTKITTFGIKKLQKDIPNLNIHCVMSPRDWSTLESI